MSFVNVDTPVIPEDTGAIFHLISNGKGVVDLKGGQYTCLGSAPTIVPKDTTFGAPNGFSITGFLAANAITYPSTNAINLAANTPFTIAVVAGPYGGADYGIIGTDDGTNGWGLDFNTGIVRFYVRNAGAATVAGASGPGSTTGLNIYLGGYDGTRSILKLGNSNFASAGAMGKSGGAVQIGRRINALPCLTNIYEVYVTTVTPTALGLQALYRSIAASCGLNTAI